MERTKDMACSCGTVIMCWLCRSFPCLIKNVFMAGTVFKSIYARGERYAAKDRWKNQNTWLLMQMHVKSETMDNQAVKNIYTLEEFHMRINQILEFSMIIDNERFQKVFDSAYRQAEDLEENEDGYIDRSLTHKGITGIYRDSRYKKKVRLIVNTHLLLDDVSDTDKLIRKLDKRIAEYFNSKYHLDDFHVSGINLVADIDVGTRSNVQAYLKAIKRIGRVKGFSPAVYEYFDDGSSFCLSGNSNGIDFLLYDLERAAMSRPGSGEADCKRMKSMKGILRAEVRLMKAKAVHAYTDADDVYGQIEDLSNNCWDVFLGTFTQIIPFGDYYKKDKAVEIVRKEVADSIMRRRMLRLLVLIPEKKSLHLAQKSLNCRNIEKVMDAFAKINLSPITISKRQDVRYLENLYSCFLCDQK